MHFKVDVRQIKVRASPQIPKLVCSYSVWRISHFGLLTFKRILKTHKMSCLTGKISLLMLKMVISFTQKMLQFFFLNISMFQVRQCVMCSAYTFSLAGGSNYSHLWILALHYMWHLKDAFSSFSSIFAASNQGGIFMIQLVPSEHVEHEKINALTISYFGSIDVRRVVYNPFLEGRNKSAFHNLCMMTFSR